MEALENKIPEYEKKISIIDKEVNFMKKRQEEIIKVEVKI